MIADDTDAADEVIGPLVTGRKNVVAQCNPSDAWFSYPFRVPHWGNFAVNLAKGISRSEVTGRIERTTH
ncbi:hypothetical protein AWB83_01441 [Caballeronia ptereochthonis]|uniref:Uncharacterized protein n=1 Tax=Caballeronia ptereochthonis TaxID=1777144 RepID=A0A158A7M9_9BURK|nr:hypothetical protein AWB83_01441 [Caballeronia ptereochthonis]